MSKKGQLKPVDEAEQAIRDKPLFYSIAKYTQGRPNERVTAKTLQEAQEQADLMRKNDNKFRTIFIYAVGDYDRVALVSTYSRLADKWKVVVPQTY